MVKINLMEKLQDYSDFTIQMDSAFRDLRADFDVSSLLYAKNKIEELKSVHIDTTKDVASVATLSVASNGVVSGLRGTGKSHLLLLSRNMINQSKSSFCVYINLKEHFNIGGTPILDERFYVWVILLQVKNQLKLLSESTETQKKQKFIKLLAKFFDRTGSEVEQRLEEVFDEMDNLISFGEKELSGLSYENSNEITQEYNKNKELSTKINPATFEASAGIIKSDKEVMGESRKYNSQIMLNTNTLKALLVKIVEILELKSIVFYYDEWSSKNKSEQDKLSKLIQALSTSPLYHWIAYIPYRSSLGVLELTADMPHVVELDQKYIYEENNEICRKYFTSFADKRLEVIFKDDAFNLENIISNENIDMLIKACMGNTRDFGILLFKAWSNYKSDIIANKRYRCITKQHVVKAIKALAREKLDNLKADGNYYSEKLWNEIVRFVGDKKHTHFCIELNKDNQVFLNQSEFQNLLYHRLIHLRKNDISPKDGGEYRLSIYAIDMSTLHSRIYETRNEKQHIFAVTDINIIHNQIRHYIFDLSMVINGFRVEQGKQILCKNCSKAITSEMKLAWELKKCIFCGEGF